MILTDEEKQRLECIRVESTVQAVFRPDTVTFLLSLLDRATEQLTDVNKRFGEAWDERLAIESALVDALGALQFYAREAHWKTGSEGDGIMAPDATRDAGKRARVTVNRIFDRALGMSRVQAMRTSPTVIVEGDGTHGCDTCGK